MIPPFGPIALARLLVCLPFFVMLFLMLVEASLNAATTYLVIEAGGLRGRRGELDLRRAHRLSRLCEIHAAIRA
jgi:hypothetical protein